ncbi:hypothetical protein ACF0H5_009387 [Mactra antiquata]
MISEGEQFEIELLTYPCCTSSRTDSLQEDLNHHIVNELQSWIYDQVKLDCYGCQVDHPSQVQHVLCLYASSEEWVELYIEKALLQLEDSITITGSWKNGILISILEQTQKKEMHDVYGFILWKNSLAIGQIYLVIG